MRIMINNLRFFQVVSATALVCFLVFFLGCSAGGGGSLAPGKEPGLCPLNCSNWMVGSNDPQFEIISPVEQMTLVCGQTDTETAVRLEWLAVEKYKVGDTEYQRPVPFLSFEIVAPGLSVLRDNGDGTLAVDSRVETPPEFLCSDACGVMVADIKPLCPTVPGQSSQIKVMVHSGPLFATKTVDITVQKEDNN